MDIERSVIPGILCVVFIILAIVGPIVMVLCWKVPADVQYGNLFGADVAMATEGATTLTGPNSIQDYVMRIWNNMNATFDTRNFAAIHNNPWPWGQTKDNTLAKQNEYFNSLNQSLYTRQAWVDAVISGKSPFSGGDPVQTAINQSRYEMKAYGGLDWVINGAWYLTYAPLAYWTMLYLIIWVILFAVLALIAGVIATS